jgi:WD40 repeat protein
VDLRWARDERYLDLNDPRFRDCMASLAAPMHGVPKDSLIGEDIREHRRALRLARGGAGLLALFLVGAIVAATIAVAQRNTALARQVASAAVNDVAQRLDRSMLLAVEGYREENTPQARTALFQAVTASPQLVRFADNGTRTTALAAATDAAQVVTGGEDGSVRLWDVAGGAPPQVIARFEQQVTAVGISPDAGVVAVGGADGLIATVDRGSATPVVLQRTGPPVSAIALSGSRVAAVDESPRITLFDTAARRVLATSNDGVASPFANPSVVTFGATSDELLLGTFRGETSRWSTSPLQPVSDWTHATTPAGNFTSAYSTDRRWFGYYKFGVYVQSTGPDQTSRTFPLQSRSFASAMAISPDASRVAVASEGTISVVQAALPYVSPADPGLEEGLVADPLSGIGAAVTDLSFVGGNQRLVSASQHTLALWDLRQQSRIAQAADVDLPDQVEASTRPGLVLSARDGTRAWVGDDGLLTVVQPPTATSRGSTRTVSAGDGASTIFLSPDGRRLYSTGSEKLDVWALDEESLRRVASWHYPGQYGASFVAPTADASAVYAVQYTGETFRVSTQDGSSTPVAPAVRQRSIDSVALRPDGTEMLVIDAAGGTQLVDLRNGGTKPGPTLDIKVASASYSSDGRYLAVSDGQASVLIWDVQDARVVHRIAADRVVQVSFSPTGDRVATTTEDGRITLWNTTGGARLGEFQVRQFEYLNARDVGYQTRLVWEPSGDALWTATTGGTVVRWDLDPLHWIATACSAAGRSLTSQDWEQAIGSSAPRDLSCRG